MIQAAVLLIWWPKSALAEVLETGNGPDTLLAVVIAVGATVAYYSIRAGGEEILLPGQHSLREWALETPVRLARVLSGYVIAHLLQTLHALLLSTPLLLIAFSIAGGEWRSLEWALVAILVQATFYRFTAAIVYLTLGHRENAAYFCQRAVLLGGYLGWGALLPAASHIVVSFDLLGDRAAMPAGASGGGGDLVPAPLEFIVIYVILCLGLAFVLFRRLLYERRMAIGTV